MTTDANTLAPGKRPWLRRFWMALLSVAVLLLLSSIFVTGGGITEFNPHTLQSRGRREITTRHGRIPLYYSRYHDYPDEPLAKELVGRGLVQPVQDQNNWQTISHWNTAWKGGDGFWYDVLTRRRRSLLEWSDINPELAKIYWSEVFRYMRSEHEVDQETGRNIQRMGWKVSDERELRKLIRETRVYDLIWARHSDDPAERAYAESEYQRLWPRKSRR